MTALSRAGRAHHTDAGGRSLLSEGWMVRTCPAFGHHFAHAAVALPRPASIFGTTRAVVLCRPLSSYVEIMYNCNTVIYVSYSDPPPWRRVIFVPPELRISARRPPLAPAAHALAGLPDGAGLVPMDPAEVPNQSEPRRRAPRDHQPPVTALLHTLHSHDELPC